MAVALNPEGGVGGIKFFAIVRLTPDIFVILPVYPKAFVREERVTDKSHVQLIDVLLKTTLSPYLGIALFDQLAEFEARLPEPTPVHVTVAALAGKT